MNKNKLNTILMLTFALIVGLSCSTFFEGKKLAEAAVKDFHGKYNKKEFSQIYKASDTEFKKSTSEEELNKLLEAVYRKLGKVKKSEQTNWKVNSTTAGTIAVVTYDVDYADGKASEVFSFKISGDKARLMGFNINSPDLITK